MRKLEGQYHSVVIEPSWSARMRRKFDINRLPVGRFSLAVPHTTSVVSKFQTWVPKQNGGK
jgi:hypothetical protein